MTPAVLCVYRYNVDVQETAGKIMNDNMGDQEFYNFLLAAYQCMHQHLADDGSIYVWHADTEGLNFRKAFGRGLLSFRLLHLEKERAGAGPQPLPVDS